MIIEFRFNLISALSQQKVSYKEAKVSKKIFNFKFFHKYIYKCSNLQYVFLVSVIILRNNLIAYQKLQIHTMSN